MRIENAINDAVDYFMENPSRSSTGLPSQTDVRLVLNDLVGEEGYGRASQSASVKKVMVKLKKLSKNLLMENPRRVKKKSFRISYGTGPAMTVKAHTIQEAERIFHKKAKTLRRKLGINMKRKPKGEDLFDFRHRTYLSHANGMWSVIWKGIPLNASTPSRSRAEAVAKQYNVKLPGDIWTEKGWVKDIGQNRRRGLRRNPIDSMRVYAGRDGFEITDFKKGDKIELHPATDLWMRGARYGKIIQVGRTNLKVKLDYLRRAIAVSPRNIGQIVTRDYYR